MSKDAEPIPGIPITRRIKGTSQITNLNSPDALLRRPFGPISIDRISGDKVQISDEQTSVVATGSLPEVLVRYRDRLISAAAQNPQAVPQLEIINPLKFSKIVKVIPDNSFLGPRYSGFFYYGRN